MGQLDFSIIISARNEANGIVRTLACIVEQLKTISGNGEVIVVANGCDDHTAAIASAWLTAHVNQSLGIGTKVLDLKEPGKLAAINSGIFVSRGTKLIHVDADVTVSDGGLPWVVSCLDDPKIQLAGLYYAADAKHLPDDPKLALVIRMAEIRRFVIGERYFAMGHCMGWRRGLDLKRSGHQFFPEETPVADDTWLNRAVNHYYGQAAIAVNRSMCTYAIPPQTWDDYYSQLWRYGANNELINHYFPEFAGSTARLNSYISRLYPEPEINKRWREECYKDGINFADEVGFYKNVEAKVRAGKLAMIQQLVEKQGLWEPVATARLSVSADAHRVSKCARVKQFSKLSM